MSVESGRFAEKARKQRQTPAYKAWRVKYEKTERFRNRVRAYQAKRRQDPMLLEQMREYCRRHKDKNRILWLARSAIKRSQVNGLECDEVYLRDVVGQQRPTECPCCGIEIDYGRSKDNRPLEHGPSLDRIDCTKGYIAGNIDIICWRCNAIKRDATLAELETIVSYMRRHLA
jgi:hypothetical protein